MRSTSTLSLTAASLFMFLPLTAALSQGRVSPPGEPNAVDRKAPEIAPGPPALPGTTTDWRASKLIGTTMTNVLNESIGTVDDVVIDSDGKVVAVLVNVGGFLGLGETPVAIGLRHLVITQPDPDHLEVKTSLTRGAIEQAASLDPNEDNKPVAP